MVKFYAEPMCYTYVSTRKTSRTAAIGKIVARIFVAKRNIPEKVYLSVNNLLIRVPNPLIFE